MENLARNYRKRLSNEQKYLILSEHFEKGTSLSELARTHQVHPITLYNWKRQMAAKKNENSINPDELLSEIEKLKKENESLKKALGNVSHEKEVLKDINDFLKKKYREQELKKQKNISNPKK